MEHLHMPKSSCLANEIFKFLLSFLLCNISVTRPLIYFMLCHACDFGWNVVCVQNIRPWSNKPKTKSRLVVFMRKIVITLPHFSEGSRLWMPLHQLKKTYQVFINWYLLQLCKMAYFLYFRQKDCQRLNE